MSNNNSNSNGTNGKSLPLTNIYVDEVSRQQDEELLILLNDDNDNDDGVADTTSTSQKKPLSREKLLIWRYCRRGLNNVQIPNLQPVKGLDDSKTDKSRLIFKFQDSSDKILFERELHLGQMEYYEMSNSLEAFDLLRRTGRVIVKQGPLVAPMPRNVFAFNCSVGILFAPTRLGKKKMERIIIKEGQAPTIGEARRNCASNVLKFLVSKGVIQEAPVEFARTRKDFLDPINQIEPRLRRLFLESSPTEFAEIIDKIANKIEHN